MLRQIMAQRRSRPIFVIDVAVPRDINPEANNVEGFFLYDIDDLQSVAAANLADRAQVVAKAEAVVGAEVERLARSLSVLDVVPTIRRFRNPSNRHERANAGLIGYTDTIPTLGHWE